MAAAATFRRGDVIARRYQVVTKSGETSLWIGYHGFDKNNQTSTEQKGIPEPDVIIKVVRPELLTEAAARSHLSRELQRVKGLQHPGMPRLIDVQPLEEMATVALIEPIQSGLSQGVLLRRMVTFRKNEGFPLAEVRQISAQLASALSYIHGQMMCHGDLRLESVILRPDGAKLGDIGLGAALPRGPYLDAVRKAGEAELLAPEVRAGKQPDPRSDVFGLASLYRHLISLGQQAAWDAFLSEKPAMGMVLVRGMAEEPSQRYSSIEALIADVEAVALTGAPIRKRLAQTPLAMAVAAGRLPAEELSRPVEEIAPESQRSRRNTGAFEVNAVLAPLSGGPAAKMSIGTIPANLSSSASSRSGRVPSSSSSSAGSSHDSVSGASRNDNPSSSSLDALSAVSTSNRITLPGRSKVVSPDGSQPNLHSVRRGGDSVGAESMVSTGSGRGHPRAASSVPLTPAAGEGSIETPAVASPTAPSPAAAPSPPAAVASPPPAAPAAAAPAAAKSERRAATKDSGNSEAPPAEPSSPGTSGAARSRRSASDADSPRSSVSGSRSSPQPSGSSPRGDKNLISQQSIPPHMVVASRRALIGVMLLASLVGALVAVVVLLLVRPALLAPPSVPSPSPPASSGSTLPVIPPAPHPASSTTASPSGR